MKVKFYNVKEEDLMKLQELVNEYNFVIKNIFLKDVQNRVELINKKNLLAKNIEQILNMYSEDLYITEDEFNNVSKIIERNSKNNIIKYKDLENIYLEIDDRIDIKISIKNLLKLRKDVFFWIC